VSLTFVHARLIAEQATLEHAWLHVQDGHIADFGPGDPPDFGAPLFDAQGRTLLPGFIDVHVHGGGGFEVMDATAESLDRLSLFFARHGVTSYLPTTWTAPHARILAALSAIRQAMSRPAPGALILGAHVEGPYLSRKHPGAQDPNQIRPANPAETADLLDTGIVRLMALAPEIPENLALLDECAAHGITVSAAHTDATFQQMQAAVARGLTHVTHTFNAMRGLHHREPGTVGAALTLPQLRCELIADGHHVHPQAVQLLFQCKGPRGLMLITDAVRGAGLAEGTRYDQDGREVRVAQGTARLTDGTLAGSVATMDQCVHNLMRFAGATLEEASQCASLTPAESIGVADRKGSIAEGKDADLVLWDSNGSVAATFVGGVRVSDR
jgi:N-acetylglucosamine-6-phosphate deacetylase